MRGGSVVRPPNAPMSPSESALDPPASVPELPPLAAARWWTQYFRFHGVWAPGVRVMRNLSMNSKAVLVMLAFVLPLAVLVAGVALVVQRHIAQTGLALRAADQGNRAFVLIAGYNDLSPGLLLGRPADGARLERLHGDMLALIGALEPTLVPAASREALAASLNALDDVAADQPQALLQRMGPVLNGLIAVHDQLTDHAGLLRNDDETVHAMVRIARVEAPQVLREVAVLRIESARLLAATAAGPLRADDLHDRRLRIVGAMARLQDALGDVTALTREGPGAALAPQAAAAVRDGSALLGEIEQSIVGIEVVGEVAALNAVADRARSAAQVLRVTAHDGLMQALQARRDAAWHVAAQWAAGLSLLLALAMYLLLCFLRTLAGGVHMLRRQVARLAEGDLSARPQALGRDEVGAAIGSLGETLGRMSELLAAVKQGIQGVTYAAQEIAQGSGSLSRRTEQSGEHVAALLGALTTHAQALDETRQRVVDAQLAVQALRMDSMRTQRHMGALAGRMSDLQAKSRDIASIVNLIDGLAHRTSILALNASVEAAKAGTAGRGFAVVALEVRTLAQRSAEAARRISGIVMQSTDDIEQGHALTALVSGALSDSATHVESVHGAMDEAVRLSREGEQSTLGFIAQVRELESHGADNRALVVQLSTAADALQRQGDRLGRQVDMFTLS